MLAWLYPATVASPITPAGLFAPLIFWGHPIPPVSTLHGSLLSYYSVMCVYVKILLTTKFCSVKRRLTCRL